MKFAFMNNYPVHSHYIRYDIFNAAVKSECNVMAGRNVSKRIHIMEVGFKMGT